MGNSINLLYRDLVSEVNRRRITMTMRYSQPLGAGRGGGGGWDGTYMLMPTKHLKLPQMLVYVNVFSVFIRCREAGFTDEKMLCRPLSHGPSTGNDKGAGTNFRSVSPNWEVGTT